ncbi:murein transglycosylase A [Buchnera aphidicola]|uniref:peptidoglycan lytic exotransglycosylase n=1 Tax=Buchnera aphidicola str. USDA (Myzus persicae) TaxID=1009856 RepID=W0NZN9_BUCMP|nr:murein transglycosylase A [Buchnera aphidicola]AHG59939.1 Mlta [Buchnera aphidicola str. USDA (Myzus persicae)]AHG60519.1 Mlta [Buchnera aphidicola str. W106 (Myzus persicae)]AHG61092.1 Mlta [Buchnera aphidicola str. G002 (Myzus persicae)]AHG61664.1 Mlta [Buchnera aphidicola str. F009 (Myzus persicae)]WAI03376.1 MAG: murein transglycosylase A [Buchnera aphidicola (Myzus persicae)]
MKKKIVVMIFLTLFFTFTVACMNEPTNKGQQYKKKLIYNLTRIKKINIENKLINPESLFLQINKIKKSSPSLYFKNKTIYTSIEKWLKNSNINEFYKFGINLFQMKGTDNYGNVKISGYYTPIIKARKTPQKNFIYPIYSMPYNFKKKQYLPKRKEIYNGILDKRYILAYTNSLIDNFIMEIQGSAFIDYENNKPLKFFSYSGSNGWPYKSIGQILINRGEIEKKNMSMQAIKNWCKKHTNKEIKNLFEENTSFVFFKETQRKEVYGASSVPLVAKTSIAADTNIIKKGTIVLLQIPLLDKNGIFIKKYEMRLVIALDVGGAIKGQHFDLYTGIGEKAGKLAGFYNHYGHAWILKK